MNQLVKRSALEPSTLSEAITFSQMLARSTMVPKDFQQRPENILVALQWGREIGLGPLQALQNIAIINGRPSVWGDAMLALVRGSPSCVYVRETIEGEGEAMEAVCRARRVGDDQDIVGRFSVADAKEAGLWNKAGPWKQYPKRMLQMRARGFCLRDAFPDILKGVISAEEARDMPVDQFSGTTIDAAPEPPTTAAAVSYPPAQTAGEAIGDGLPPHSSDDPLMEPSGTKWLKNLRKMLLEAESEAEVVAIAGHQSVTHALKEFPASIKDMIKEYLTDAYARFKSPDETTEEEPAVDEAGDFIAGLRNMTPSEVEKLDTNAAHKAWLRGLSKEDYDRVAAAITDRLIARAGA